MLDKFNKTLKDILNKDEEMTDKELMEKMYKPKQNVKLKICLICRTPMTKFSDNHYCCIRHGYHIIDGIDYLQCENCGANAVRMGLTDDDMFICPVCKETFEVVNHD